MTAMREPGLSRLEIGINNLISGTSTIDLSLPKLVEALDLRL